MSFLVFVMTLGRDFTFEGNQYHLEIYGEEMWSDLLFFNRELNALVAIELKLKKTAFLASSTISSETVLQVYDWATEMRNQGECVISGFSSKLEQDVLHFLLKGCQPIIIVLARRMYRNVPDELKEPLAQNRLLLISVSNAIRQSKVTAMSRNKYLCEEEDTFLETPTVVSVDFACRARDFFITLHRKRKKEPGMNFLLSIALAFIGGGVIGLVAACIFEPNEPAKPMPRKPKRRKETLLKVNGKLYRIKDVDFGGLQPPMPKRGAKPVK